MVHVLQLLAACEVQGLGAASRQGINLRQGYAPAVGCEMAEGPICHHMSKIHSALTA